MKKNILIIGGSGFLGSHVSDEFSKKNYKVTIVDKKKSKYINKNQKFINLDLKNIKRLSEEIKKFDIIYYFADIADIQESKKNYMSTINQNLIILTEILKLIVNSKVKNFVYASSLYVFSEAGSFYRATKQCAEILIKEFSKVGNFSYKFVRYGSLYGERAQEWNGISKFISQIKVKGTVTYQGNGKEVRDYVHVKDVARAHALAVDYLNNISNCVRLNLGSGKGTSVLDVIKAVDNQTDLNVKYTVEGPRAGDPAKLVANISKAKDVLGWEPDYGLDKIIHSAYNWYHNKDV